MLEAIYVSIGLLFGVAAVWITSVKTLKERLEEQTKISSELLIQKTILEEKIKSIGENREQMRLEFKELAQNILESNSQKFSNQNQESLQRVLSPVKEQFLEFKRQIEDVYIKEAKERSMLQVEIKNIKEINHQMSQEAKNLTNALKGESKKQGIWGEMVLERILENSGLRKGLEYEREVALEHEEGRYRPDVVVRLPGGRDIIIDAKTSLSSYERHISSQEDEDKERFAKEHLASVKNHIKELAQKDYIKLKGLKTQDFVFMFIPIESALITAMEYDSELFDYAFKKNIVLVGPTALMVSLRAVENGWRQEKQQQNAQEIANRAGILYDKFCSFIENMQRLGKQLSTAQRTYDETFSKMHDGASSITKEFEKLKSLGAKTSKSLPKSIADTADD